MTRKLIKMLGAGRMCRIYKLGIVVKGIYVELIETRKEQIWLLSTFSDGYHIIGTLSDLTEDEQNKVYEYIKSNYE